ncbi:MAG: ATP-binding cassette domain-containing protein [Bacteroidales bacterium]|nr:ATP-binding cassette domain-containing protein [Bacteroidales bacterium]
MSTAIEFNNVSKQYRLGLVSTKTLSHDLNRWWQTAVLRKEDPYLKIGSVNDRTKAADSEYVWALKDIDFKVEQGDVVGIIGKNGAGKSTLLKLLSRVTAPTTGTIRAKGRIGALLEVGTGFHSEMTGRENIYMNGAILGMTKPEIAKKLDEIIDFSGCERYIDTPVKRYSSGMMVRLGFAVAAHLDPEILVVDEVLAVGDAEFQKKAIGKMQDVSQGEGRTVLFVSHNMASIKKLCKTGVILQNGQLVYMGDVYSAVDNYMAEQNQSGSYDTIGSKDIVFSSFELKNKGVLLGDDLVVDFELQYNKEIFSPIQINVNIFSETFEPVVNTSNMDASVEIPICPIGTKLPMRCVIKNVNLTPGKYNFVLYVGDNNTTFQEVRFCMEFSVEQGDNFIQRPIPYPERFRAVLQTDWSIRK